MNEEYYRDKICIVTGSSSGIGFELSKQMLEMGSVVYLNDISEKNLQKVREQLGEYGNRARYIIADVTDAEAVQNLVDTVMTEQGRIDFMVNNAGIAIAGFTENATLEHWKNVIDVNLWGVIYGVYSVLPIMKKQGFGHIVNVSSIAGLIPFPYQTVYVASKYGVVGLSECLRLELAPFGVAVSVVCPTNVYTPIFEKIGTKVPDDAIPVDYAAKWILERVAQKKGIIPVAEIGDWMFDRYWKDTEEMEKFLSKMEAERRENLLKFGGFYA